jgi:hypothetical protein
LKKNNETGQRPIKLVAEDELAFLPFSGITLNNKTLAEHFQLSYTMSVYYDFDYHSPPNTQVNVTPILVPVPSGHSSLDLKKLSNREISDLQPLLEKYDIDVLKPPITNLSLVKKLRSIETKNHMVVVHFCGHAYRDRLPETSYQSPFEMGGCLVLDSYTEVKPNLSMEGVETLVSNNDVDRSLFFARDIALINLSNVQLVILNNCNTYISAVSTPAGHNGLARAFLAAGAQCVIATLVEINDSSAREFTRIFYKELLAKKTISTAFNLAINQLRQNFTKKPEYWLPYILYGNADVSLNFLQKQ